MHSATMRRIKDQELVLLNKYLILFKQNPVNAAYTAPASFSQHISRSF